MQTGCTKLNECRCKQFRDEVEKYLTGESEPSELIYFKVFRSQLPVIEQALEIAARMLGSDKSRGYCLEMICCRLPGRRGAGDDPEFVLQGIRRLLRFPASPASARIDRRATQDGTSRRGGSQRVNDSLRDNGDYQRICRAVLERDGWRCQHCGVMRNLQVHHLTFRSHGGSNSLANLIVLCADCHRATHAYV